jgi:phosphoribosylanthranilate isomerase
MTVIKICGLRTVEHALAAATAGADLLGLVFAPSKRQVQPEQAAALIAELRRHPAGRRARVVGVFVNTPAQTLDMIAAHVGLDYVQLSGDEAPADLVGLRAPFIKALRLDGSPQEQRWLEAAINPPLLVDAHVPGSFGGSGQFADWGRAALLAVQRSILLAGGLTPENVAHAIAQVHPWGVDVSSGVETNGVKDVGRIEAFIQAARSSR